jgi:hypothetical protein
MSLNWLKNIVKLKGLMSFFTKEKDITSSSKKTFSKKDTPSYKKYHSIQFLPVDNFILVIRNKDLRYLLKLEDYEYLPEISEQEQNELQSIWETIEEEYAKEDRQQKNIIELEVSKTITDLQNQYMIFNSYVFLAGFKPEFVEKLGELGYRIDKTKSPIEALENLSKQVGGQILTRIRIKQAELERYQKVSEQSAEFEDVLDVVEKYKGHYLNTKELTVKRWISIKNNFIKHAKEQENARRSNKSV